MTIYALFMYPCVCDMNRSAHE